MQTCVEIFGFSTTHTRKIERYRDVPYLSCNDSRMHNVCQPTHSFPQCKAFSKKEALTSRRVGGARYYQGI